MNNTLFSYDNFFDDDFKINLPTAFIYQIAELCIKSGGEVCVHEQVCDEFTVVLSGSAEITANKEIFTLSPSQIHFIKKGSIHAIRACENFRYICIGFEPKEQNSEILDFFKTVHTQKSLVLEDGANIKKLSEMLLDEFYSMNENSDIMLNMYICQILISAARLAKKSKKLTIKRNKPDYTLYTIMKYIDKEYRQIKNVAEISQALSYSESYMSHLFREKLDMTVKEYLLEKKLSASESLLTKRGMSVAETAQYLNFYSVHSFSVAFKKRYKISPMKYKQQKNDV